MICFYGTVRLIMLNCLEGYEIRKTLSVHIALSLLQNHPFSFAEKAGKKQTLQQFPFKYHLFRHLQPGCASTTHCAIHIVGGC